MKSNYKKYDFEASQGRIDDILSESNKSFEELKEIPSSDKLTYTNGFYVTCTALFVDIRGSSNLTAGRYTPTLAKIYRSYISEAVAVINGNLNCAEINIHGDSVWGVFNTPYQNQVDSVFSTAAKVASMIDMLNGKLAKKKITTIDVGIGLDYGRALMIKAGYKGSGLNDVVWMGKVVNEASKLCGYGNRNRTDMEIMVSDIVYSNLNEHNQNLLTRNYGRGCYHGNVINTVMDEWVTQNSA